MLGVVWNNVRKLDVLDKDAFQTANSLQMLTSLIVHGTCKNHFTCNGKNGIAKMIVDTTVWLIERKKGSYIMMVQSNIMVNGPSSVSTGCRFVIKEAMHLLPSYGVYVIWFQSLFYTSDVPWVCSGACFCGFLCSQSCDAFSWFGVFFYSYTL